MSLFSIQKTLLLVALFLISSIYAQQIKMTLKVDATDTPKHLLHTSESIETIAGPVTLYFPRWIPGYHDPSGPVVDMAGLFIKAGGKTISWRRDPVVMNAIHCDIPEGTNTIDVNFDFILPPEIPGPANAAASTAKLLILEWNHVLLYPEEIRPDSINVAAEITLPVGWKYFTALRQNKKSGNKISFNPVSLTQLIDSPLLTGEYARQINITPSSGVPHFLDLVSDYPAALEMNESLIKDYKHLVTEANALFGTHHYNHYDFLCTLSDNVYHDGLEHHQSSDNRMPERTYVDSTIFLDNASLLAHEFTHSWNGKFRRPIGLATGDYSTPMKGNLLWVYEGLTQYLGKVLAARSGLYTPEQYRDDLANLAALMDHRPSLFWRPLQDAADEAQLLYYTRDDYDSWRGSVDFYSEGNLIWLEVDATIRQLTNNKKSLDDFCKIFHGGKNNGPEVKPYDFNEVLNTLNEIAVYDWKNFFLKKLNSLSAHTLLEGIDKSGWKLVYKDEPNEMQKISEEASQSINLFYSIGITVDFDGKVQDVLPGSPADSAGMSPGIDIIAVNGRRFSREIIHEALKSAKVDPTPIQFIVANGDFYSTIIVEYYGGEKYPYLEHDNSRTDLLTPIISPLTYKSK
jgi:predicted metalloprotease with PDZ domain